MEQTSIQRTEWFRKAKYGLFFHWGPMATTGRNEWTFFEEDYTVAEYRRQAALFDPAPGFAEEWAQFAVDAGATYAVFTTRHHDGYCNWDSATTDFTSTKMTPGRDLVREYVDALRAAGIKVGLYYSLVDWRYKGGWDPVGYPDSAANLVSLVHNQIRELLTNYGSIDILWFDGAGPYGRPYPVETATFWRSAELWEMALGLQPGIIINDRSGAGGDFATPECEIKPDLTGGAWESCLRMDPVSWAFLAESPGVKTAGQVAIDMLQIAAGGGNLLLNTGPDRLGHIRPHDRQVILEAGRWRKRYREAFAEATLRTVFGEREHVVWIGTPDPQVYYLATKAWSGTEIWYPRAGAEVVAISYADTGIPVEFDRGPYGRLELRNLPATCPDPLGAIFQVVFADVPRRVPGGFTNDTSENAKVIESDL